MPYQESKWETKWRELNAVERATIEKRYSGKSHAKIEEELASEFGSDGFTLSTLKNYFAEGGKLFEIYYWYASRTNDQRDKEARVFWEGMIMNAVAVVSDEMNDMKSPRRLTAALAVIDAGWGKPYQKIEFVGKEPRPDPSKFAGWTKIELEAYERVLYKAVCKETGSTEILDEQISETGKKLERLTNIKETLNETY